MDSISDFLPLSLSRKVRINELKAARKERYLALKPRANEAAKPRSPHVIYVVLNSVETAGPDDLRPRSIIGPNG